MNRVVMLTTFEKSVKCFFDENGQLLRVNVIQDDVIQYYVLVKKILREGSIRTLFHSHRIQLP